MSVPGAGEEAEIRLGRCTLRPFRTGDEASLALHADNRNVWINLRDRFPHPYRLSDAADWIRIAREHSPRLHLAVDVDGAAVGGLGIIPGEDVHRRSAEIGFWLGEPYWGRGLMTEAAGAMVEYAFSRFDLCRLWAGVYEWNDASARVLEKTGFVLEGRLRKAVLKDGRTADMFLYALVR